MDSTTIEDQSDLLTRQGLIRMLGIPFIRNAIDLSLDAIHLPKIGHDMSAHLSNR
jgi:hypothetical protein